MPALTSHLQNHKFKPLEKKIIALKKSSTRFKVIFREYENISEELWNFQNSADVSVSDDFLTALQQQSFYLEEEIEDWLHRPEESGN